MKKVSQIIGMMSMVALLAIGASSCKKDNTKMVSSFDFNLPAIEGESGIEESKAYMDMAANQMKWYDGDAMMIYSIDEDWTKSKARSYSAESGITGATQAHFTGSPMEEGSEGFFAFYPASKASTEIAEGNRAYFNVGETQTCETDLFAGTSYAGKIFMDPTSFVGAATCEVIKPYVSADLKHIFGYINVRVKDSKNRARKLTSVTIKDSNMHLTGSMSIEIPALKSADLDAMKQLGVNYKANGNTDAYWSEMNNRLQEIGYMPNGTGFEVTLDCSAVNGGAVIDKNYKYFLIPLRPGALMGDFTVTLKFAGNFADFVVNVPADKRYISIPGYYTNVSIDTKSGLIQ
jgi:hypothetical protein